jgi:transposase
VLLVAPVQEQCRGCGKWIQTTSNRTHVCLDCRHQQEQQEDPPVHPPAASTSSPSLSFFGRPTGCIDQLSEIERSAIITLHEIGWTGVDIAHALKCSENTVSLWTNRWRDTHSIADADRSGRPRCTDDATDVAIEEYAEEKKRTVPKEIKKELQLDCSARTIRRRLDEVGLFGRVGRTEYIYDEHDIQRRLSFAEGYANWTTADWDRVIFSDETHIEVYGRSRVWVQRPSGAAFDPDYMVERVPHSERVSLWGCFCGRGVGQAEIFVGEFNAKRYVDILQHNLLQTALHFYPNEHWWFQQDNAPQHTADLSRRWFHNHGVSLLDFPPYSPDLNPIENLWSILKGRIEKRLARTTDEIERVLKEEWEALDKELLTSLAHSMPTRCAAVIANHGHKAPY